MTLNHIQFCFAAVGALLLVSVSVWRFDSSGKRELSGGGGREVVHLFPAIRQQKNTCSEKGGQRAKQQGGWVCVRLRVFLSRSLKKESIIRAIRHLEVVDFLLSTLN